MDHLLIPALIACSGGAVFLRIVAKEKHRREKYLTMRLEERIKAEEKAAKAADSIELQVVDQDAEPSAVLQPDEH